MPFSIIGLVEDVNSLGGSSYPAAYIPITLLPYPLYSDNVTIVNGAPVVDAIDVLATNVASIDQAQQEIEMMLRLSHGLSREQANDFTLTVDSNFLNVVQDSSRILYVGTRGHRRHQLGRRRHRHHEYYACHHHRTDARNWHSQGSRRPTILTFCSSF